MPLILKENSILRIENEKQKLIGSHETSLCEKNNEIVKLKEQFDQVGCLLTMKYYVVLLSI